MQLQLIGIDESYLQAELERRTGMRISLTVTNNSSSLMAFYPDRAGRHARLRIHHMFLNADTHVIGALATWLTHRRHQRSAAVIDAFIRSNEHLIQRAARSHRIRTAGLVHDLSEYYHELNASEFANRIATPITWGRMATRARRRSIRLGSYSPEDDIIRIHPNLDQTFVPDYFVRYIVFHEMLHADLGVELAENGRRRVHTPEFNRRERAYREYARAMKWHDAPGNLDRLMRVPEAARTRVQS